MYTKRELKRAVARSVPPVSVSFAFARPVASNRESPLSNFSEPVCRGSLSSSVGSLICVFLETTVSMDNWPVACYNAHL